jgi:hypothetical protein
MEVVKIINKLRKSKGKKTIQHFQQLEKCVQQLPPLKLSFRKYTKANKLYPICFYDKVLHKLIFYYYQPELKEQFQYYILNKYNILIDEKELEEIRKITLVDLPTPQHDVIDNKLFENVRNMEKVGLVGEEEYEKMVKLYLESKKVNIEERNNKQPIKLILEKIKEVEGDDDV